MDASSFQWGSLSRLCRRTPEKERASPDRASDALGAACPLAAQAHEVDPEPADRELVPVGELGQLHALAVPEDTVEAAVVEDPRPSVVAVDERVAPRDRRVVEADVGGQAPPDPGPAVLKGNDSHALIVLERQVVTLLDERFPRLLEPRRGPVQGHVAVAFLLLEHGRP